MPDYRALRDFIMPDGGIARAGKTVTLADGGHQVALGQAEPAPEPEAPKPEAPEPEAPARRGKGKGA